MGRGGAGNEGIGFDVHEYAGLWAEHGIEDLREVEVQASHRLSHRTKQEALRHTPSPDSHPELQTLEEVRSWLGDCRRCGLCEGRNQIVFGAGNPKAKLMFVGEGPGADEDKQGFLSSERPASSSTGLSRPWVTSGRTSTSPIS